MTTTKNIIQYNNFVILLSGNHLYCIYFHVYYLLLFRRNVKNVWVIDGGYEGFKRTYPFLCGNIQVPDMLPMPHQIEDNLFLGSRAFSITPESLQQLSILYCLLSYIVLLIILTQKDISHVIVNKSHDNATRLAINSILITTSKREILKRKMRN